jgi:sporulation protein YlmC with PRC-barrel domain
MEFRMSKTKLLASVAVAALMAMPAFAQTSSPSSRPSSPPSATAPAKPSLPSDLRQMKVSELVGKNVYTSTDEKIGDIDELVVSKTGSKEPMAVIGVGGFLGIGEKKAAVPLDQLKVQGDKIVATGVTKDSLKQHADYKAADYEKVDKNKMVSEVAPATPSTSGSSSGSSSTNSTGSSTMGGSSSTPSPSGSSSGSSGSSMGAGTGSTGSTGSGSSAPSGNSSSGTTQTPKQ